MKPSDWTSATVAERHAAKVDRRGPDDCWPWLGSRNVDGYGSIDTGNRIDRAHRVAWALINGRIPEGMCICHSCDNPPCCNTAHLWLGTNLDNVRDRDAKGRRTGPRGEANGRARLSASDVSEIRRRVGLGVSHSSVAREFRVDRSTVSLLIRGRTWRPFDSLVSASVVPSLRADQRAERPLHQLDSLAGG